MTLYPLGADRYSTRQRRLLEVAERHKAFIKAETWEDEDGTRIVSILARFPADAMNRAKTLRLNAVYNEQTRRYRHTAFVHYPEGEGVYPINQKQYRLELEWYVPF